MLGWLRFVLALLVVIAHLANHSFVQHWGIFAVFGFYIVSGYLMTLVLHETYRFRLAPFAVNRFLRLYPVYYITAILSAIAIGFLPGAASFHDAWSHPWRPADYLGNLGLFPYEFYDARSRLVPPTWSVAVELVNYFLLWLFVARSPRLAGATWIGAILFHVLSYASGDGWRERYAPFYAALLPFATGANLYFYRKYLPRNPILLFWFVVVLTLGNLLWCGWNGGLEGSRFTLHFYLNGFFQAIVIHLAGAPGMQATAVQSGKRVGDLAYPLFLLHWIVAFLISHTGIVELVRGFPLLLATFLPLVILSYGVSQLADFCIEPLRHRIRLLALMRRSP